MASGQRGPLHHHARHTPHTRSRVALCLPCPCAHFEGVRAARRGPCVASKKRHVLKARSPHTTTTHRVPHTPKPQNPSVPLKPRRLARETPARNPLTGGLLPPWPVATSTDVGAEGRRLLSPRPPRRRTTLPHRGPFEPAALFAPRWRTLWVCFGGLSAARFRRAPGGPAPQHNPHHPPTDRKSVV